MTTKCRRAGLVASALLVASLVVAPLATATEQEKTEAAATPGENVKDERALKLLKEMSETLVRAKTLSFSMRGLVPITAPTGQFISLFASTRVMMKRPDKLFVEARGDLFPSDLYYDGKTVTAISSDKKFYAQRDAAGGTIEAVMREGQPGSDTVAPFFDLLVADPLAGLTNGLSSALWVGQSTLAGIETDHLAFTGSGVDWEIWIGAKDKLPRLMVVSYRSGERQLTFTAEFSDWKLDAAGPAPTFVAPIPEGAVKLEFKANNPMPPK